MLTICNLSVNSASGYHGNPVASRILVAGIIPFPTAALFCSCQGMAKVARLKCNLHQVRCRSTTARFGNLERGKSLLRGAVLLFQLMRNFFSHPAERTGCPA